MIYCNKPMPGNGYCGEPEDDYTGDNYMGATCIVISQCAPFAPCEFFTYPGDASQVRAAMDDVCKRAGHERSYCVARERRRPSSFDAFDPTSIRKKKWYADHAPQILSILEAGEQA